MAEAQDPVRVPGYVHGWGSCLFKFEDGTRINGITKFGYGDSRKRTKGYGAGRHQAPTRRSAGKYEVAPGTTDLYKETAQAIRNKLAALAEDGASYGNTIVQIELICTEPGAADIMVELHDCVIDEDKSDHSEGPDGLMDQLSWDVMRVVRDGKTLYDGTEGQP